MRTLVEQTRDNVAQWLGNLDAAYPENDELRWLEEHSPVVLMGGEESEAAQRDWDIHPERPCILIGTQDMLLSRALNRGYGMSRYRWPMHFGLLNNDALWVVDEVQLMGNGLATGIQLDAFRSSLWPTSKPCVTWWMSATPSADVFQTTDRKELVVPPPEAFGLEEAECQSEPLAFRLGAEKALGLLAKPPKAAEILKAHQAGRLTLVVANTVDSAIQSYGDIRTQLDRLRDAKRRTSALLPEVILMHSRFRRTERREQMRRLQEFLTLGRETGAAPEGHPGLIVVATQVVEAGVDLSAAALWSEVPPWASVIQRLGRLNRDGRQPNAAAWFWMPKPKDEENGKGSPNAGRIGPYEKTALKLAEQLIKAVGERRGRGETYRVALDAVLASEPSRQALKLATPVVIRADDVYGLFSTEPDLAGGFTNIAPYVRSADLSSDVTVYWRDFKHTPPTELENPGADETLSIPSHRLSRFLSDSKLVAFTWDEDTACWQSVPGKEVVPGMTLLLPVSAGGYSSERGWTGNRNHKPSALAVHPSRQVSLFSDGESNVGWQPLAQHTAATKAEVVILSSNAALDLPADWQAALRTAAEWHDAGKAHRRWQGPLLPLAPPEQTGPWGKFKDVFRFRPGARHEALSLLAAWKRWLGPEIELNALALYLIASHHGKVRTCLRSVGTGNDLFGWRVDDEPLLAQQNAPCAIDLSVKNFAGCGTVDWTTKSYTPGRPSWNAIMEELLGPAWCGDPVTQLAVPAQEPRQLGPFQLAYLETVFRAADARASRVEFNSDSV